MTDHLHPAPRDEESPEECQHCGHAWTVAGVVDYGAWSPLNEDDMNCPECGKNVLED